MNTNPMHRYDPRAFPGRSIDGIPVGMLNYYEHNEPRYTASERIKLRFANTQLVNALGLHTGLFMRDL